jgi:transposase
MIQPNQAKEIAGIDVSKGWLDVACGDTVERIANTPAAVRGLARRLRRYGVRLVGLEPTGRYEKVAVDGLRAAGFDVRAVDSWRLRQFAKGKGRRAKTDPIDARMIACFVAGESTRPYPQPSTAEQNLQAWTREVTRAEADLLRLNIRLKTCELPAIVLSLKAEREALKATIRRAEQAIAELIEQQADLQHKAKLLDTMPGVGRKTIRVLLAEMPELGALPDRQAASLAGVAPHPNRSGKRRSDHISGGRAALKRAAYLAATAALLHNPWAKSLYRHLRAKGKSHKVVVIAIARRIVVTLNAMLRTNTPWNINRSTASI